MATLYSTSSHASGDGRNGHVLSDDGLIDMDVRVPAGYAACFHSALRLVANEAKVDVTGSEVSATVHLQSSDTGGFGIGVELDVSLPAATPEQARAVTERAHQVCPYSNATRGNVDVQLSVV